MAYTVKVLPRAARDLSSIYGAIHVAESDAALRWYEGLKGAILSLSEHPERCAATPERKTLRHLLYGNKPHVYRVIFRVLEKQKQVEVLHIRHGARRWFRDIDVVVTD